MATRLYFPNTGSPGVTPSDWEFGRQATTTNTWPATTSRASTETETTLSGNTGTTNPDKTARARWVYGPLAAQTISGTVKGQNRGYEGNAGANATLAVAIKIVQSNGTDRAVLLAPTAADTFTDGSAPEFATGSSAPNRQFRDATEATSISLTSQSASAGDYLVIEVGWRSATGTSRTINLKSGIVSSTNDLPEDETSTSVYNPWIEFSQNLLLQQTVNVSDSITVADVPTVQLRSTATSYSINVSDSVTVTDSPSFLTTSWRYPVAYSVVVGSKTGGSLNDTWDIGGGEMSFSETTGTPAFNYEFNWGGVPTNGARSLRFRGYYKGNPAHEVLVQQYNFGTTGWEDLYVLPSEASVTDLIIPLAGCSGNYLDSGTLAIRFLHTSPGNITHILVVDYLELVGVLAVFSHEDITVTDVPTVSRPDRALTVAVGDDVTVTDVPTVTRKEAAYAATGADAITVTDVADVRITAFGAHAADSVTVTDVADVRITAIGAHADTAITVTDVATVTLSAAVQAGVQSFLAFWMGGAGAVAVTALTVSAAEAATVTDVATVSLTTTRYDITVADTVTVADVATVRITHYGAPVFDTVTVADVADVALIPTGYVIQAAEAITVADVPTVTRTTIRITVDVAETVTVADVADVRITAFGASASDSITVSDVATVALAAIRFTIAAADSITVTDTATVVRNVPGVYTIPAADDVTVTDAATVAQATIRFTPTASETVTVTDVATVALVVVPRVTVSDTITVADVATVQRPSVVTALTRAVSDSITVTDVATVALGAGAITASVADSVTVTDVATVSRATIRQTITADTAVTVADVATVSRTTIRFTVTASDTVSVTDAATVLLVAVNHLVPAVADTVTVTDVATVVVSPLRVQAADTVSVVDGATVTLTTVRLRATASDAVTVTDVATVALIPTFYAVSAAEAVSVTDVATVSLTGLISDGSWRPRYPDQIWPTVSLAAPAQQVYGANLVPIPGRDVVPANTLAIYPATVWRPALVPEGTSVRRVQPLPPYDEAVLSWQGVVPDPTRPVVVPLPGVTVLVPQAAGDLRWAVSLATVVRGPWAPPGWFVLPLPPPLAVAAFGWLPVWPDLVWGRPTPPTTGPTVADLPRLDALEATWTVVTPDGLPSYPALGSALQLYAGGPVEPLPDPAAPDAVATFGWQPATVAGWPTLSPAHWVWAGSPETPAPLFDFANWLPVAPDQVPGAAPRLSPLAVRPFVDLLPGGDLGWLPVGIDPAPSLRRLRAAGGGSWLEVGQILGIALFQWTPVFPGPQVIGWLPVGLLVRPWVDGPWPCPRLIDVGVTVPTLAGAAVTLPTLLGEAETHPTLVEGGTGLGAGWQPLIGSVDVITVVDVATVMLI